MFSTSVFGQNKVPPSRQTSDVKLAIRAIGARQIYRNSGYLATSSHACPMIFHSSRQFLPRFTHKMLRNSYFSCFEVININEFGLQVDFYFIKINKLKCYLILDNKGWPLKILLNQNEKWKMKRKVTKGGGKGGQWIWVELLYSWFPLVNLFS